MKEYKNVPLTRYTLPERYVFISDELIESKLDDFKNKPIVKDEKVIGVILQATSIDKETKIVYGDIDIWNDNHIYNNSYFMSIDLQLHEEEEKQIEIKHFNVMSIECGL